MFKGKHSEETRHRLSEAQKRRYNDPRQRELTREAGHIGGVHMRELHPDILRENGVKYGPKGARRTHEVRSADPEKYLLEQAAAGRLGSHDDKVKAGSKGGHVTWHVNRGRFNPKCEFCIEGET